MTAPTHIAFAELLYLLILTTTGVTLNLPNALFIAAASVLPDIDTGASRIGKTLPFVSLKLERRFGHRTLTHSLICVVAISLLLLPLCLISSDIYICLLMGYLSHPLLDTATLNGVKLFYPFSGLRCVFPLDVNNPQRYRVQTGSRVEKVLGIIFVLGCIPTFYIAFQGYERFIRITQQSIEAAVRDYEVFSRDNFVMAEIDSHDMLTKQPFKGFFEIVGALNPHTLVFKSPDGHLRTVGKSFEADYVAEAIICRKDRPSYASVRTIDMSNQLLAQLTALIDTSVENYFFGNVATMDRVSLPENIKLFSPVTGSGGEIKLNFATMNDIREYNLEFVFVTKGLLTVKSISPLPTGHTSSTAELSLPKLENFAQLSYLVAPKDSVTLFKKRGDAVLQGDLIAVKITPTFYEEQIALNEQKLNDLESQLTSSMEDYNSKIASAQLTVSLDSTEFLHTQALVTNRYVPSGLLNSSELKWRKERRALSQIITAKQGMARRISLDIARTNLLNAELRAKSRAARLQAEIRSPVAGVLLEVRQMQQDNNTRIVFIIKRTF